MRQRVQRGENEETFPIVIKHFAFQDISRVAINRPLLIDYRGIENDQRLDV